MTKTLHLVRHAKSSWSDMTLSDFDRPLNARGLRDAPKMGNRLGQRTSLPEIVLCSPARRSRQTAELLLPELGGTMDAVQFDERIYEAATGTLLDCIRSLPSPCTSAMLIGHNPAIGELANWFSHVRIERMPTCAIATVELMVDQWSAVGNETSRLLYFDYPKKK